MPWKEVKLPNNVTNCNFPITLYSQDCLVNDLKNKCFTAPFDQGWNEATLSSLTAFRLNNISNSFEINCKQLLIFFFPGKSYFGNNFLLPPTLLIENSNSQQSNSESIAMILRFSNIHVYFYLFCSYFGSNDTKSYHFICSTAGYQDPCYIWISHL